MKGKMILTFNEVGIEVETNVENVNDHDKLLSIDAFCQGMNINEWLLKTYIVAKSEGYIDCTRISISDIEKIYGKDQSK